MEYNCCFKSYHGKLNRTEVQMAHLKNNLPLSVKITTELKTEVLLKKTLKMNRCLRLHL